VAYRYINVHSHIHLPHPKFDSTFTPELEIAARHAKEQEATVITCCCTKGTSLEEFSDVYAYCRQKNTHVIEGFDMMSNLPLHLISKIIIDYLML
jgi:DNA-binding MurR/RpiR family transcriptional regulator